MCRTCPYMHRHMCKGQPIHHLSEHSTGPQRKRTDFHQGAQGHHRLILLRGGSPRHTRGDTAGASVDGGHAADAPLRQKGGESGKYGVSTRTQHVRILHMIDPRLPSAGRVGGGKGVGTRHWAWACLHATSPRSTSQRLVPQAYTKISHRNHARAPTLVRFRGEGGGEEKTQSCVPSRRSTRGQRP
jgi:hypothetical protein